MVTQAQWACCWSMDIFILHRLSSSSSSIISSFCTGTIRQQRKTVLGWTRVLTMKMRKKTRMIMRRKMRRIMMKMKMMKRKKMMKERRRWRGWRRRGGRGWRWNFWRPERFRCHVGIGQTGVAHSASGGANSWEPEAVGCYVPAARRAARGAAGVEQPGLSRHGSSLWLSSLCVAGPTGTPGRGKTIRRLHAELWKWHFEGPFQVWKRYEEMG